MCCICNMTTQQERIRTSIYVMGFLALLVEIGVFKEVSSLLSHLYGSCTVTASLVHY